ncbi:MAG: N-acetyltransferase [Bryobacteraceae bacterium]
MNSKPHAGGVGIGVRLESPSSQGEHQAVRSVIQAAFVGDEEANLVEQLRGEYALLSLVAERDSEIIGHALFSRMWIQTPAERISAVALAPLAIRPGHQRQGTGGRLIREGLAMLRRGGERIVIVVGHPGYYPRFGFSSEKVRLLESPFSREAFMGLELADGALAGVQGAVVYPPPFGL